MSFPSDPLPQPQAAASRLNGGAPRVLISNATRLHAHHHAYALQKAGLLERFVTSIWHKAGRFPFSIIPHLPTPARQAVESFLSKRRHPELRDDLVEQNWAIDLLRLIADAATGGRFRDWILVAHKSAHDNLVARRVAALKPDVVVGFEVSCARTFERARGVGAVTVLDLAGLHHDFTDSILVNAGAKPKHGRVQRWLRARKRRELELADHILVISELARQTLVDAGIGADRISVVRLGVSLNTFAPKTSYRDAGPFRILFVGNVSRAKGVDVLLDAFAALDQPGCELVLIGPVVEGDLTQRARVAFTHIPYLDHDKLAAHYRDADVFVLPTRLDSWGLVVTEAMACGTPVIVTNRCGAKEIVSADCGWIVEAGDDAALITALKSACVARSSLKQMGECARAAVETLDWDSYHGRVADRIAALWTERRESAGQSSSSSAH